MTRFSDVVPQPGDRIVWLTPKRDFSDVKTGRLYQAIIRGSDVIYEQEPGYPMPIGWIGWNRTQSCFDIVEAPTLLDADTFTPDELESVRHLMEG